MTNAWLLSSVSTRNGRSTANNWLWTHQICPWKLSSLSIMPGRTWRDNGHKALCPLSKWRRLYDD
eukprot:COSAG02_NODE_29710_length_564_cov_1.279570_1_plen_64_part_01